MPRIIFLLLYFFVWPSHPEIKGEMASLSRYETAIWHVLRKTKNKKAEFEDGLPPGSKLFMSQESAYTSSAIF